MAQSLEHFTKNLLASGLPFAAECEAFLKTLPADKRPADGEQCARLLVKEKKLTAYQAQEIYAGRGKKLVLANYVIQEKLGQGGMGMVLKAEHKRMGRIVALKVMSAAGMANPDAVKRFHREVQAAAKLSHPNIVRAFDADEAVGLHFLVMEYVAGADLSQLVKKNGPLSVEKALHCILQAAEGLEFAHEAGVVHRDIKPANLLVNADGTVKILDMGLARIEHTAEQAELTGTGQIMGTVDYMAPEQALSTRSADHRADIYALGITLWYLLTGRVAYDGETLMAKLLAHSSGPIPSLAAANPEAPPALEAVFRRMVAKTPAERYQSMSEVRAALERCRSGESEAAPVVELPSEDSKLSDFLRDLGGGQPGRSGIGSGSAAPAAASATVTLGSNPALEQTIVTSGAQGDTDPQTQNVTRAQLSPSGGGAATGAATTPQRSGVPTKPWHADWRVWAIGGGSLGAVLLIGLVAMLLSGGGSASTPPIAKLPIVKPPVAKPGPIRPAVAGEPVNYALQFDGVDDLVELTTLTRRFTGPYTVEARVKLLARDRQQFYIKGPTSDLSWLPGGGWKTAYVQPGQPRTICTRQDTSTEVHIAAVFDGTNPYVYVNGKRTGITGKTTIPTEPLEYAWMLGAARSPGEPAQSPFAGELDELRVSTVARYTAEFPLAGLPDRFTPDKETLALYHFDEGHGDVLKDSSGNNHHGKITGAKWVRAALPSALPVPQPAPPPPPAPAPKPPPLLTRSFPSGYALLFDGTATYVEAPGPARPAGAPYTLEAWVELRANDGTHVALKWGGAQFNAYQRGWDFLVKSEPSPVPHVASPASTVVPGRRTHLAGVFDGKEMTLYVDGVPYTTRSTTAFNGLLDAAPLLIGSDMGSAGKGTGMRGLIDEVRLSSTARYQQPFTPADQFAADADTLALYHFDEGQGDVLKDSSGNNHHGKITGARWVEAARAPPDAATPPYSAGLEFDGISSYVQVEGWKYSGTGSITFEIWAELFDHDSRTGRTHWFGDLENGGLGIGYAPNGVGGIAFIAKPRSAPYQCATLSSYLRIGQLVHLAGVLDDQKEIRLYRDGKLEARTPCVGPLTTTTMPFLLGANPNPTPGSFRASEVFRGRMYQFRISSGTRYTADFAPAPRLESDAQTLLAYRFDEGQGDVLKDASGNNYHGKIVGAKWVTNVPAPVPVPSPAAGTWRPLFNGKDLTGWTQVLDQSQTWSVEKGELICRNGKAINHLVSSELFADFDLVAEVLFVPGGNSGIFFRTRGDISADKHEVEIGSIGGSHTGDLVGLKRTGKTSPVQPNEWATIELIVRGQRFMTRVNGQVIDDWTDPACPQSGKIALQCLPANTEVRFRRLEIRPAP